MNWQVPPKEANPPISLYRGVRLADTAGSSSIPALAAVQPGYDDAAPTHHTQGKTLSIHIPYSDRSHLPPWAPPRLSLGDESLISSSPAPSSLFSAHTGSPLSTVTTPSPGPITTFQGSSPFFFPETPDASINKPPSGHSVKEPRGTVYTQNSTPQPYPPTPPQSQPPIPKNSHSLPKKIPSPCTAAREAFLVAAQSGGSNRLVDRRAKTTKSTS